jgi:uncharacterized protein
MELPKIIVQKKTYAIVQAKQPIPNAFANIMDGKEITVIIDEKSIKNAIKADKGWKIITFDAKFAFTTVGFLAKVSSALANENIPILAISSFSTDHILVKQKYLKKALKALANL